MRQELWQINSFMLALLALMLTTSLLLRKTTPSVPFKPTKHPLKKPLMLSKIEIEEIYKNDLFDTYSPIPEKKEDLISAIPQPKEPETVEAPKKEDVKLAKPLEVKLKGILFSSDTAKSVALMEDEAGKEQSYVIGEKIKDALVVKIARDKVVMVRDSGQQEVMYLKKPEDEKIVGKAQIKWENTVNKVEENFYEVDRSRMPMMVSSLAQFLDDLDLITAYKKGKPLGLEVGTIKENTIGKMIGLQKKDIIVALNDVKTSNLKDRYKAFLNVMDMREDDEIKLSIKRQEEDIIITYKITSLPLEKEPPFEKLKAERAGLFTMSRDQKREEKIRTFQEHHPEDRRKMLKDIRRKLLENIEKRERNMRIR